MPVFLLCWAHMKKQPKPRGEIIVIHSKNPIINLLRPVWALFKPLVDRIDDEISSIWFGDPRKPKWRGDYSVRQDWTLDDATWSALPRNAGGPGRLLVSWYVRRFFAVVIALFYVVFFTLMILYIFFRAIDIVTCSVRGGRVSRSSCVIDVRK